MLFRSECFEYTVRAERFLDDGASLPVSSSVSSYGGRNIRTKDFKWPATCLGSQFGPPFCLDRPSAKYISSDPTLQRGHLSNGRNAGREAIFAKVEIRDGLNFPLCSVNMCCSNRSLSPKEIGGMLSVAGLRRAKSVRAFCQLQPHHPNNI